MVSGVAAQAGASQLREIVDQGPMTGLQVSIVAVCFMLYMLDGFDVLVMSFTAPPVADEWGLAPHQLGAVFSAALFGMMIGAMFLAPLADAYGRRPVVIGALLIIGIAMVATGFVTLLWQLVILRAITGLGIGAMLASLTSTVSEYTPNKQRNFSLAIVQAGYPIGAVGGGLVAAQIIPDFGWRAAFLGGGMISLLMAVVCFFALPESIQVLLHKRPANALEKINQILVRMGREPLIALPHFDEVVAPTSTIASLLIPQRRKTTLLIWSAFCLSFITLYFLISWIPKLLVDAGLSLEKGIYAAAALNLGGALGIIVLGKLSAYFGLTRLISLYLVGAAVSMAAFAYLTLSLPQLLALTTAIGFFIFGGMVSLYTVAARIYPTEIRTTGIGWAIGMGRVGAIIGPYLGGVFIGMGISMDVNFLIFAAPAILAGMCAIMIRAPELSIKHG